MSGETLLFAQLVLAHRMRRDRYRDKMFSHGVRSLLGYMPPMRFTTNLYQGTRIMAGLEQEDALVMLSSHIAMQTISKHRERLKDIINIAKAGGLTKEEMEALYKEAETIKSEIADLAERMEAIDD